MWNGRVLQQTYPELFSFTMNTKIVVLLVLQMESLHDIFQLPLLVETFAQYCELDIFMQSLHPTNANDTWSYIWNGFGKLNVKQSIRYFLVASSGQVKHKGYAKKKKFVLGLSCMQNVH
jgi:hypothetical protein